MQMACNIFPVLPNIETYDRKWLKQFFRYLAYKVKMLKFSEHYKWKKAQIFFRSHLFHLLQICRWHATFFQYCQILKLMTRKWIKQSFRYLAYKVKMLKFSKHHKWKKAQIFFRSHLFHLLQICRWHATFFQYCQILKLKTRKWIKQSFRYLAYKVKMLKFSKHHKWKKAQIFFRSHLFHLLILSFKVFFFYF